MRLPAEWESHSATWLCWPHNPETWPGALNEAEHEYERFVELLSESESVHVLVQSPEHREHVAPRVPAAVALHEFETDDSWMRDTGPTFVERDDASPLAIDWTFNSWGGKYSPWDRDDATAAEVARLAGVECRRPGLVLEGGALESNGDGTLLLTRSSAVGDNRNAGLTQSDLETRLRELLGARRIVWIDGALEGDDTDAHIDNLARFTPAGHVVCASEQNRDDPNFAALRQTARQLNEAGFEVMRIPLPPPRYAGAERLPASHLNFYLANDQLLIPGFGGASDDVARGLLQEQFPKHRAALLSCRALVRGLGTLHCLSQQQPRAG